VVCSETAKAASQAKVAAKQAPKSGEPRKPGRPKGSQNKEFSQPLKAVTIAKTHRSTRARAHVVLLRSDLTLAYDQLIDYYRLRFQVLVHNP